MKIHRLVPFLFVLAVSAGAADLTLAPLFRDGAVLQRNQTIPVWGSADPGEDITVSFHTQSVSARADSAGRWQAVLAAEPATGQPAVLTVAGHAVLRVNDVVVGDVWLCSGQSNMELRVDQAQNAAQEVAAANYPLIRQFKVPHTVAEAPADTCPGTWAACAPATAGQFTAAGYYFARELFRRNGVPIGLINSTFGGTPIESWIGQPTLRANPSFGMVFQRWNELQRKPATPKDAHSRFEPAGLYNGMIHPLEPYALRGFLWYQGEANGTRGDEYGPLFTALIREWRSAFAQGDLPFYFVQLPGFERRVDRTGEQWAHLREGQQSALALPATAMVVTIDIGEPSNLHPKNKQEVGRRLALCERAGVEREAVESRGPVFVGAQLDGTALRVRFTHAQGLNSGGRPLDQFELAGSDHRFVPAQVRIDGESLLVSAPSIAVPLAVRYAWRNSPTACLFNAARLPAAPFCSAFPPGVVIDASPEPMTSFVGSPSIVILPNGSYVASHDYFGARARLGRTSRVFGSSDRGQTWRQLAIVPNLTWATLFVHRGALYLLGPMKEYGDISLRRSDDGGRTWTVPTDGSNGLIFPGTFHCGPTPVVEFGGRIWRAFERYGGPDGSWSGRYFHPLVISAAVDADLLQAKSWRRSNDVAFDGEWVPGFRTGWLEGNVVPTPDGGLVDLLRVNAPPSLQDKFELTGPAAGLPRYEVAARITIGADGREVRFEPSRGFFRFPGSQSKFTIRFDSKSGRYWSLANLITNIHSGYPVSVTPEMQRNVLALTTSADLVHWEVRSIVLRWHEGLALTGKDKVAFQYPDWQFDGDDLVAAVRTSWNGQSFHNANYLTFHRVPHFRTLTMADSSPPLPDPSGPGLD